MKPASSGREEIRLHAHIAIQQHDDVVARGAEAGIRAAAEAEILRQREHADLGIVRANPVGAAIGGTVVDDDDFAARVGCDGGEPGGQKALQQIAAIPVGNDERSGVRVRFRVVNWLAAPSDQPEEDRSAREQLCRSVLRAAERSATARRAETRSTDDFIVSRAGRGRSPVSRPRGPIWKMRCAAILRDIVRSQGSVVQPNAFAPLRWPRDGRYCVCASCLILQWIRREGVRSPARRPSICCCRSVIQVSRSSCFALRVRYAGVSQGDFVIQMGSPDVLALQFSGQRLRASFAVRRELR